MKKLFAGALVLAALLLISAGAFLWRDKTAPQSVRLSDGSELSLNEVSFGIKHHYHFGSPWKRFLSVLPPALATRLGQNVSSFAMYSSQPSLGLWCRWKNKSAQSPQIEFLVADANGFESRTEGGSYSYGTSAAESIEGRTFTAFPRRERSVTIQIYEQKFDGTRKKVGSFSLRNPTRGSFPTWKPDALPSTKKDDLLAVTLTRLLTGVDREGKVLPPGTNTTFDGWGLASFRILQDGKAATNWTPASLEMSDATGNSLACTSWSCSSRGDEKYFSYRWTLWPDGTPWKIRVEFSRESGFETNETCTFRHIPIPRAGAYTQTNLEARILGHPIVLLGITSDGGMMPGNFVHLTGSPAVHVQVSPEIAGTRLSLVHIVDQAGHNLALNGSGNGGGLYSYGVKIPPDATTFDITFALHKSRFFEFLALPNSSPK